MDVDDSILEITSNKNAMKNLLLKIIVLVIFILIPILTLWIGHYSLEVFLGTLVPSNLSWMGIAGIILLWYILVFAVVLPYTGRTIDNRYPS